MEMPLSAQLDPAHDRKITVTHHGLHHSGMNEIEVSEDMTGLLTIYVRPLRPNNDPVNVRMCPYDVTGTPDYMQRAADLVTDLNRIEEHIEGGNIDAALALAKSAADPSTSLRPRPGETAADALQRVTTAVRETSSREGIPA